MRTLLIGECAPERTYRLEDPDAPGETEFEYTVVKALACAYPKYYCCLFGGTFALEPFSPGKRPDVALVARDFSHWFVVEVELTAHSLYHHVLPQIRAFVYGEPQADCARILADRLGVDLSRAQTLVALVPRTVAVVANRFDAEWAQAIRALNAQLLVVSVFTTSDGQSAVEIEGDLQAMAASLGFGVFRATDRSLRFPLACGIPRGTIQLVDDGGTAALWSAVDGNGALWVTKVVGTPDFSDGGRVQVLRTMDGRFVLRRHA